jgi:sortase A
MKRVARRGFACIALLLALVGTWQVAQAGWIHAKGWLAQRLIASAWEQASAGGASRRPWPWADMRPVARLTVPSRGIVVYVLDNANPRALAFGPAHVGGTAAPGTWGNTILVAHRDTHFRFLATLAVDDEIDLETGAGRRARYRVRELAVVDRAEARLLDAADSAQLTLITCYPFDAILPGSAQRYRVVAERFA